MFLNRLKDLPYFRISILKTVSLWTFRIAFIGFLIFFFHQKINSSLLLQSFDSGLSIPMLTIQPLIFAGILLFTLRFSYLLPKPKPSFFKIFKSLTLTMGLNNVFPGRISELAKATYLKENAGVAVRTSLGAIFIERTIDVLILSLLATFCISAEILDVGPLWVVIFLILLICMFVLVSFENSFARILTQYIPNKYASIIEYLITYTSAKLRHRDFYAALVCSICGWFLSFWAVSTFLEIATESQIGFVGAFFVFVATVIGIAIPALPGGFGTYEAGAIIVLKEFGIGFEQALAIAISLHLSQIAFYLIGCVMILAFEESGFLRFARQLYSFAKMRDKHK